MALGLEGGMVYGGGGLGEGGVLLWLGALMIWWRQRLWDFWWRWTFLERADIGGVTEWRIVGL